MLEIRFSFSLQPYSEQLDCFGSIHNLLKAEAPARRAKKTAIFMVDQVLRV